MGRLNTSLKMNTFAVVVLVATLVACSNAQCTQTCSQQCSLLNTFCYGENVCALIQNSCEQACGGACTCTTTCLDNCMTARSNCIGDGTSLIRAGTCNGAAALCIAGCPLQCGVQVSTHAAQVLTQQANGFIGAIGGGDQ